MPGTREGAPHQGKYFIRNVLWSWSGVLFSLTSGLLLTPFVIHRLGDEQYGIWALVFSLIDYFSLADFGFRSAVLKYSAHYRATGEMERLEELIATGLVYFSAAAVLVLTAAIVVARHLTLLFPHIAPRDLEPFRFLTIAVGVGFALGTVFNTATAVLEGYQRFDITSRIVIVNNGIRVAGCFTVLALGFGLRAMGLCVLAGQALGYAITWRVLRRVLPGRSFAPLKASLRMARRMLGYGIHSFLANTSLMVLNQDAPVLIGHFLTTTLVGYYTFPLRLLSYPVDLVGRMGMVTGSKTAELAAYGETGSIARIAVVANRYCLMLFLPLAVYLSIFGRQLLEVWINTAFARNSAPLLPVLGAGIVIAVAAQYNSSSVLYGLAKHNALARAVLVEAILSLGCLWYVVPRYGIFSAACVVSGLMIASRGVYVPYAVSRHLGLSWAAYQRGIYAVPLGIAVPVSACAWLLNRAAGEPATWGAVLGGGAGLAAVYYAAVFFFGVEREHRRMILDGIGANLPRFARDQAMM
jgi:O-antigen/teichoic acid export membrane protein